MAIKQRISGLAAAIIMVLAACFAQAESGDIVWLSPTQSPPVEQATDMPEMADLPPVDTREEAPPATNEDQAPDESDSQWDYPIAPAVLMGDYVRLANADTLLESNYVPNDLVNIKAKKTSSSPIQMRQAASEALSAMFDAALADGLTLYAHSGYRNYQQQRTMYYNRLDRNNGVDDGYVAKPGASDHQTGLGIDVISKAWIGKSFNSDFAETAEAQWMAAHCAEYGFIIRYPKEAQEITGIAYEPWHLRYVGVVVARYITDNGLTLEEFTNEWKPLLAQFIGDGGDASGITMIENPHTGETQVVELGYYLTGEIGPDGDYEFSLIPPQEGAD